MGSHVPCDGCCSGTPRATTESMQQRIWSCWLPARAHIRAAPLAIAVWHRQRRTREAAGDHTMNVPCEGCAWCWDSTARMTLHMNLQPLCFTATSVLCRKLVRAHPRPAAKGQQKPLSRRVLQDAGT